MTHLIKASSLILLYILAVTGSHRIWPPLHHEQVYQPDINMIAEMTENIISETDPTIIVRQELYQLVNTSKYDEAVNLSGCVFRVTGCPLINIVVKKLLKNVNHHVMRYAYELSRAEIHKIIVEKCFPSAFRSIFLGESAKIITKSRTGHFRLSTVAEQWNDRKLYVDYTNRSDDLVWQFVKEIIDNTEMDTVYHRIKNNKFQMTLKLGMYLEENRQDRMVWADERPHDIFLDSNDGRFIWRLVPNGLSVNEEPLFCITNKYYSSYSMDTSFSASKKQHVKAVPKYCGPDSGWIIESIPSDILITHD